MKVEKFFIFLLSDYFFFFFFAWMTVQALCLCPGTLQSSTFYTMALSSGQTTDKKKVLYSCSVAELQLHLKTDTCNCTKGAGFWGADTAQQRAGKL